MPRASLPPFSLPSSNRMEAYNVKSHWTRTRSDNLHNYNNIIYLIRVQKHDDRPAYKYKHENFKNLALTVGNLQKVFLHFVLKIH